MYIYICVFVCSDILRFCISFGKYIKVMSSSRSSESPAETPRRPPALCNCAYFCAQLSCYRKEMREHVHNYPCFFRQTCFNCVTHAPARERV